MWSELVFLAPLMLDNRYNAILICRKDRDQICGIAILEVCSIIARMFYNNINSKLLRIELFCVLWRIANQLILIPVGIAIVIVAVSISKGNLWRLQSTNTNNLIAIIASIVPNHQKVSFVPLSWEIVPNPGKFKFKSVNNTVKAPAKTDNDGDDYLPGTRVCKGRETCGAGRIAWRSSSALPAGRGSSPRWSRSRQLRQKKQLNTLT